MLISAVSKNQLTELADAGRRRHFSGCPVETSTHCEMLLGFVVLVEVDAGSVVVLHGVAGQQLSEEEESPHSVHVHAPALFYHHYFKTEETFSQHSRDATSRGRPRPRFIYRFLSTEAANIPK